MTAHVEPFRARAEALRESREPPALSGGNVFWRGVTAHAIASVTHRQPGDIATRLWPSDKLVQLVTRATLAPAMTSVAGWAAELAHKIVMDALEGLGPAPAGAQLLLQSLVLLLDRYGLISAPGFVAGAGNAGFVAEGDPIPVRQLVSAAALLQPFKLATIGILTREMVESSNAEFLVGDVLKRSAAAALDVALFGSSAATTAAPAGLRNGVTALTASAASDPLEAFYEDIVTLVNAVSAVGGNGPFLMIVSPGRKAGMMMRFLLQAGNIGVLGSTAVGNDLLCIAPYALVAALSPQAEIESARAGELHMSDTPLPIVNSGVSAAPAKSLFQTDSIALKMRWPVTWALRDARAIAWLTPSAWK